MRVFVSPHFDDAIGSCGCLIHNLAMSGESVQVLTIFAGEHDGNISEFAKKLLNIWQLKNGVTERALENEDACNIIGATCTNFSYIEALYRKEVDWLYPFDGDMFGPIKAEDAALPMDIARRIMHEYKKDVSFYFPSGRGLHVDHLLVEKAGEILHSMGYSVKLYTDFSYTGDYCGHLNTRRKTCLFQEDDLIAKIRAVNAYKSQLKMLFGIDDSADYFTKENKLEEGEVYEAYYEVIKC